MPRIMNMSGFPICQSSEYNGHEISLVLEQAPLIFEIELFLICYSFWNKN